MSATCIDYDPHDDNPEDLPLEFDRSMAGPEFFLYEQELIRERVAKELRLDGHVQ